MAPQTVPVRNSEALFRPFILQFFQFDLLVIVNRYQSAILASDRTGGKFPENCVVMGCNDNSPAGFAYFNKQSDDTFGCFRIKIACRFIRQYYIGVVQQGPSYYNTLLFPPESWWAVCIPYGQGLPFPEPHRSGC